MFKVGDVARLIEKYKNFYAMPKGSLVKVIKLTPFGELGVESLVKGWMGGHNLDGLLENPNGYYIDSKFMTLVTSANVEVDDKNKFYLIFNRNNENNTFKAYVISEGKNNVAIYWDNGKKKILSNPILIHSIEELPEGINIKVLKCDTSNSLLINKKKRSATVGQVFPLIDQYTKKIRGKDYIIYNLKYKDDCLNVINEDCEIQYPDLKGYNFPKDKSYKIGRSVKCIYTNKTNISKDDKFEILDIENRNEDNKLILVLKNQKGIIIREYANKFKII